MWLAPIIALALAAGDPPDSVPAPADPAAVPDAAAPAEAPKPTRLAGLRPTKLPDGTYAGPLEGALTDATLELTIVNGFITRAVVRRASAEPMPLKPTFTPDDLGVRLGGRVANNFLRLNGGFWDSEHAVGRFEGTVDKQRLQGTWRLARR